MARTTEWTDIEVKTATFHRCPSYKAPANPQGVGCWGLQPFHFRIYRQQIFRWLDSGGGYSGSQRRMDLAEVLCPGLICKVWGSKKSRKQMAAVVTDHGTAKVEGHVGTEGKALFGHVVTTPCLILFLLLPCTALTPRKGGPSQTAFAHPIFSRRLVHQRGEPAQQ